VNGETIRSKNAFPKPDRLFACVGKGIKSAITEFRYGLEGKLGLEMDYELPIMQAWVLLPQGSDDADDADDDGSSLFLLSVGDRSTVLQLSSNASEIAELDDISTRFDLRFRTIAASTQGKYIIQVTEHSIVVFGGIQW
jgi:Mono-functional DNA-alkylating methyl methanesulfonate N-term